MQVFSVSRRVRRKKIQESLLRQLRWEYAYLKAGNGGGIALTLLTRHDHSFLTAVAVGVISNMGITRFVSAASSSI